MKLSRLRVGVFISSFLIGILLANIPNLITCAQANLNDLSQEQTSGRLSQNQLCELAKSITVKVLSGNTWGSGILIGKDDLKYSLITNGHVLKEEKEFFTVETYDSQRHSAFVLVRFDHGEITGNDLAILQFESPRNLIVATLAQWNKPNKVMAAGFPLDPEPSLSDTQGFMCTPLAEVFRKLDRPMKEGYQLGYFLSIRNGMSGGPLFNDRGQVVGINGMGDPAIFSNPEVYLYRDGSRVSESINLPAERALELLASASWAIPSESIIYFSPDGLNLTLDSSNISSSSTPVSTLSEDEIRNKAQAITVQVVSLGVTGSRKTIPAGSGVLVKREGNLYYVVTNEHIVSIDDDYLVIVNQAPFLRPKTYNLQVIKKYPKQNLAMLVFTSKQNYNVAIMAHSNHLSKGESAYVSGFPSSTTRKEKFKFVPVKIPNEILNEQQPRDYNPLTYAPNDDEYLEQGMGGGSILNSEGKLIGIHRQSGENNKICTNICVGISINNIIDTLYLTINQ